MCIAPRSTNCTRWMNGLAILALKQTEESQATLTRIATRKVRPTTWEQREGPASWLKGSIGCPGTHGHAQTLCACMFAMLVQRHYAGNRGGSKEVEALLIFSPARQAVWQGRSYDPVFQRMLKAGDKLSAHSTSRFRFRWVSEVNFTRVTLSLEPGAE